MNTARSRTPTNHVKRSFLTFQCTMDGFDAWNLFAWTFEDFKRSMFYRFISNYVEFMFVDLYCLYGSLFVHMHPYNIGLVNGPQGTRAWTWAQGAPEPESPDPASKPKVGDYVFINNLFIRRKGTLSPPHPQVAWILSFDYTYREMLYIYAYYELSVFSYVGLNMFWDLLLFL